MTLLKSLVLYHLFVCTGGLMTEKDYPYVDDDIKCKFYAKVRNFCFKFKIEFAEKRRY